MISPLLSNIYLNEVDKMLERARDVTCESKNTRIEYARFADDLVILIDAYKRHDWLIRAVTKRLREELPNCRWKSMTRRVAWSTWKEARASAFLGSTSAISAACAEGCGLIFPRKSRQS